MKIADLPFIGHSDAYKQMTGQVICSATYDSMGIVENVTVQWEGGDVIGISNDFIDNHDPRWVQIDDTTGIITLCQFKLEAFAYVPGTHGLWLARKIE